MHQLECECGQCRQRAGAAFEVLEFGRDWPGKGRAPAVFSEEEELQLAMELLEVASEEELEQFLGNVFKSVWKGVKKVGSTIAKVAKPLGGALKAVAKTALPFVGGALGSMIPIPGVGTALGSALGRAASNALEMEMEGEAEGEAPADRELALARRFVRIAGQAARLAGDSDGSPRAVESALTRALHQQLPHFRSPAPQQEDESGRWRRRGNRIVVMGDWQ
ncbi:hypothetical protein VM94_01606 [Janthinobacterium sp. KBS0711]|uniref:hypothetical protein n=1 Tax=Janthinobacterium sp. KBS0711 TaxID=1649647 RepID=UPI0006330A28|nr:hypothetical protein [Janthinobacterium sp. KBS0711]KKO64901.1 hypothetical protein VM94_01606 [Janthinobacterium sp. KBS0711]TSD72587.1 hypothetical protein FFI39_017280 [Janthinobacterium sp. KBS0711]